MKRIISLALAATISGSVLADHRGHTRHSRPHYDRHYNSHQWVVPAIVAGAIVYGATRYYSPPPPPVQYVERPIYYEIPSSAIVEVNGALYNRKSLYDPSCRCYKSVLIPLNQ
jgi:hypothetical protein